MHRQTRPRYWTVLVGRAFDRAYVGLAHQIAGAICRVHTTESDPRVHATAGPKDAVHELRCVGAGAFAADLILEAVSAGAALVVALAVFRAKLATGALAVLRAKCLFWKLAHVVRLVALNAAAVAPVAILRGLALDVAFLECAHERTLALARERTARLGGKKRCFVGAAKPEGEAQQENRRVDRR